MTYTHAAQADRCNPPRARGGATSGTLKLGEASRDHAWWVAAFRVPLVAPRFVLAGVLVGAVEGGW